MAGTDEDPKYADRMRFRAFPCTRLGLPVFGLSRISFEIPAGCCCFSPGGASPSWRKPSGRRCC